MTASHISEFHGNPQLLDQSKEQVASLLKFMKDIPGFTAYFVEDLLKRAATTLKKCAEEDFAHLDQFTLRKLRKAMGDQPPLDPLNLLFFKEQIYGLGYVAEAEMPAMLKATFDLLMSYALVFKRRDDYFLGLELLK